MSRRIMRMPELLRMLGVSRPTYYRRFRYAEKFPEPLDLPDGQIGYWSDEIEAYVEGRGRGGNAKRVEDLPAHYSRSRRRNPNNPLAA